MGSSLNVTNCVAGGHVRFFPGTVVDYKRYTRCKVYITPVLQTNLITKYLPHYLGVAEGALFLLYKQHLQ